MRQKYFQFFFHRFICRFFQLLLQESCTDKKRILIVFTFCIVSFFSLTVANAANKVIFSIANNPNPEVNKDTLVMTTGFSATIYPTIQLNMKFHFQKQGAEKTESSELDLTGGSPKSLFYKITHAAGQDSDYFSYSSTGVQLVKQLANTQTSGFYEYREDNYLFGSYRQLEFGPGYLWENNLIYMGARLEKVGKNGLSFLYLVSVKHQFKYIVGQIQAKLYSGPQYVFDEIVTDGVANMQVNDPEFGYRLQIKGQWLPPGMPSNIQVSYGVNGLFIKRTVGVYRRFGGSVGLVYRY